ncbi:MAG: DUF6544 family protein [Acidimicrobiia bacterium]
MRTGSKRRSGPALRTLVRGAVAALVVLHGLIHLLGAAKGFGWAEVTALSRPTDRPGGALWLAAAVLVVAAGAGLAGRLPRWWVLGAAAVVVSQAAILTAWGDAWAGTPANVVLAVAVVHGAAAEGPWSARTRYRALARTTAAAANAMVPVGHGVVTAEALRTLPAPVARYVEASGAVGRPPVSGFRARISGRIRSGPDKPWMTFTGEQTNTYEPDWSRLFLIDATMAGLPTDVLHTFVGAHATMSVRLASLVPVTSVDGAVTAELDEAETVTLLNDLVLMAPAALVDAPVTWTPIDAHRAGATFSHGGHTVHAELRFGEDGSLVDFVSEDRWRSVAGGRFVRQPWSTPVDERASFRGRVAMSRGRGRWHPPDEEPFDYLEFRLEDITYLPERRPATASDAAPVPAPGNLAPAT